MTNPLTPKYGDLTRTFGYGQDPGPPEALCATCGSYPPIGGDADIVICGGCMDAQQAADHAARAYDTWKENRR